MAENQDTLHMPTLGRPFQLGMLYDSRSDQLIPGMTLWDPAVLRDNIDQRLQPSTNYDVVMEDSLDQKSSALNVEAGLKLSFLGGLVTVSGSAKYLNDRKTSLRQSRVTMQYKSTTKFEQLTMQHLASRNTQYPDIFDRNIATHVVTGITYGAEAFLIFDITASSTQEAVEIHGKLQAEVKSLATSVSGYAQADITTDEKNLRDSMKCTFYGDFRLDSNPSTYQDAVKIYQQLPSRLGENGENAVPKFVWLYPLSKLDSRAQQIVRVISNSLVTETVQIMEDMLHSKLAANDLLASPLYSQFLWMRDETRDCIRAINEYELNFKQSIMKILPGIRGGSKEEIELANVLSSHRASPFDNRALATWLDKKSREQRNLEGHLKNLKEIRFCASEADLDDVVNNLEKPYVVCLNFCVNTMRDPNVGVLQSFLRTSNPATAAPKVLWFENPTALKKLRADMKVFLDFYAENKSNSEVSFVVAQSREIADPDCATQLVLFTDGVSQIFEPPGKVTDIATSDVTEKSFKIQWKTPAQGFNLLNSHNCLYKVRDTVGSEGTVLWSEAKTLMKASELIIHNLQPNTEYEFKVAGVCSAGNGKESESNFVRTLKPPQQDRYIYALLKDSKIIQLGTPTIYDVLLRQTFCDDKAQIRKYEIGNPVKVSRENQKVILIVGATGAGKSTLINGMMNYMFNVRWEDDLRFKVVIEEGEHSEQAHSMTKWITAYTVYKQQDCPSPYSLTIIDTPGFGDTGGIARDKIITEQLRKFFSNKGSEGIDHIDAVGIVVQSSLARLVASQKYVFDCVLSVFGKDIAENIFLLVTFGDHNQPPVLAAVKAAELPHNGFFKFNNAALYSPNNAESDSFGKLFWEMGTYSMKSFFSGLSTLKPKSLLLTREVLKERESLETKVHGIQPQIQAGLTKMDEITQLERAVDQYEAEIQANQNFVTEVVTTVMKKVDLNPGEYVTNCSVCNFTCHYPCGIPNDQDKGGCAAMSGESCVVCPGKCHWRQHLNAQFRLETVQERQKQTLEELKKRYDFASGQKVQKKDLITRMQDDFKQVKDQVLALIQSMQKSLARLDEIALRPNPLSTTEYIDLLIESEKSEAKPGFKQRIANLQEARKQAELYGEIRKPTTGDDKKKPWWKF